jgi:hypothetical protein
MKKIHIQIMQDSFWDHIDPRRRQELKDSRMIQEDPRRMANLPTKPIHKEYNKDAFNLNPWFDDEVS